MRLDHSGEPLTELVIWLVNLQVSGFRPELAASSIWRYLLPRRVVEPSISAAAFNVVVVPLRLVALSRLESSLQDFQPVPLLLSLLGLMPNARNLCVRVTV